LKQTQPMDDTHGDLIIIEKKDENDDTSTPTMSKSNSKACAWGIKMEPVAFAQYKTIIESTNTNTNTNDDNENENEKNNKNNNCVEETGMYLLTHTDPVTQKTFTFGASPDGLVTEYNTTTTTDTTTTSSVGLLEIKSLWGRRHKETLPQFDQCPNRFYDQIQGQLAVCNKEWCDLMLFIPQSGGVSAGGTRSNKKGRKGKSKKKRMKQQRKAEAAGVVQQRKTKGKNYCIVRVKRNRKYWDETVLPALIQFCQEVDTGVIATTTTTIPATTE